VLPCAGEFRLLLRQPQPRRTRHVTAVRDECCVGGASRLKASALPTPQDLVRPGLRWCSIRFAARSSPYPSATAAGLSPHALSPPRPQPALLCRSARRATGMLPCLWYCYRGEARTADAKSADGLALTRCRPGPCRLVFGAAGDELLHQSGA
jgi:hypothetical protein